MNREVVNYLLYQLNQGERQVYALKIKEEQDVNALEVKRTLQKLQQDGLLYHAGKGKYVFASDIGTFRRYLLAAEEKPMRPDAEADAEQEHVSLEEVLRSSWEYVPEEGTHQIGFEEMLMRSRIRTMLEGGEDDDEDGDEIMWGDDDDDDGDDNDDGDDGDDDDGDEAEDEIVQDDGDGGELMQDSGDGGDEEGTGIRSFRRKADDRDKHTERFDRIMRELSALEKAARGKSRKDDDTAASDEDAPASEPFEPFRSQHSSDSLEQRIQTLLRAGKATDREEALRILALKLCIEENKASALLLQRSLSIGYVHAVRILEWMEARGYVSGQTGTSKKRDVLITMEQFDRVYGKL